MNRRFRRMMILTLMAFGAMVVTTPARATLMVDIGGTVIGGVYTPGTVYFDNQAGVDVNPAIGVMDIGTFLDGTTVIFQINGFTANSASPIASLAMNSNANLSPTAVLPLGVDIVISDTGFSVPPTPLTLAQTVNLLSSVGGIRADATAVGFYGDSNTNFDVDGPATGTATSTLIAGVATNVPGLSGPIFGPTPYSMTTYIHVDILARGPNPIQNLQLNANLSATLIPEPGTVLLMGTGILGLTLLARKRFGRP